MVIGCAGYPSNEPGSGLAGFAKGVGHNTDNGVPFPVWEVTRGNPLEDIRALRGVFFVMKDGHIIKRAGAECY